MKNKLDILVVEDNLISALDIKEIILKLGHNVIDIAINYDQVIDIIHTQKPHLIFMDINLGNFSKNGIETVIDIRNISDGIDIVYLTAYNDEDIMYEAYKTSPIAYIVKPFKSDDIKSTVMMSLYGRYADNAKKNKYLKDIGFGYCFDTDQSILYYKNKPIALTQRERIFFQLLINADGQPISLDQFEAYSWNDRFNTQNCFRTFVYRLRNKVNKKFIGSVKNIGYTLYAS